VRYEFRVKWRATGGGDQPVELHLLTTTGRPPEADLQALLNAPAGERANSIGKRAEATTVTGNRPNRADNESRSSQGTNPRAEPCQATGPRVGS
jgi:hypothetical protein